MCLKFIEGKIKKAIAFSLALLMAGISVAPSVAKAETTTGFTGKEVKITHESKDRYVANATFYDYYSDSQVGPGKTPLAITDALKSASYLETKAENTFQKFNNQLLKEMKYGDPSQSPTKVPLYQGYFVNFMNATDTGNIFSTYSFATNKSSNFQMDAHGGFTKLFVNQGLVDSKLYTDSNGIKYVTTSNPSNGKSAKLPYFDKDFLTSTTFDNSELTIGSVKEKVSFPFRQEQVKKVTYYEFDSSKDVVRFNNEGQLVYKGTSSSEKVKDAKGKAGFFPYNSPTDSKSDKLNFGFGTKIEIPFTTTSDGKINGQDIIFEFEGDDDVWVYIDGDLALDMGGSHNSVKGAINLADMTTFVQGVGVNKLADVVKTYIRDTSKTHTLTFFYLERGEWQSNMKLRFNLPEPNNITVVNEVKSDNVNKTFLDATKAVLANEQFVYGITDKNLNEYDEQVLVDKQYVSYTDEFKYNDTMQLKVNGLKDTNRKYEDLYNVKYVLSDPSQVISSRKSAVVYDKELESSKSFVFRNKSNTSTPFLLASFENQVATGNLEITNSISGVTTTDDKFEYTVVYKNVFGGASEAAYYNGEYILQDADGNEFTKTTTDGKIVLKGNQKAIIKGIPTTTQVAVQQGALSDEYKLEAIDVTSNFKTNENESLAIGDINKKTNEVIFAIKSNVAKDDPNAIDDSPRTGDSADIWFWVINIIAALGVTAMTGIIIYRRKHQN